MDWQIDRNWSCPIVSSGDFQWFPDCLEMKTPLVFVLVLHLELKKNGFVPICKKNAFFKTMLPTQARSIFSILEPTKVGSDPVSARPGPNRCGFLINCKFQKLLKNHWFYPNFWKWARPKSDPIRLESSKIGSDQAFSFFEPTKPTHVPITLAVFTIQPSFFKHF